MQRLQPPTSRKRPDASTYLRFRGRQPLLQVPTRRLRHLRLRLHSRQPLLRSAQLVLGRICGLGPGAQLSPRLRLGRRGRFSQPRL
jgi:hypothetical protein